MTVSTMGCIIVDGGRAAGYEAILQQKQNKYK